jgi:hypothetical protein
MAVNNNAYTYDDGALREDLLDVITQLSPSETQLVSGLGTTSASSIRHEWLEDSLTAAAHSAAVEGADFAISTLTNPSRKANYTQIFRTGFQVTDTERATNNAGFSDRYAYESTKALKILKNNMEFALVRGSLATGTGSAARQLAGIKNWLSVVTNQSGTSLSEAILNDRLQSVWNQGTEVNAIYCGMNLKRRIASFVGNATQKNVSVDDKRLINSVDVYSADSAKMVKLFPHRYVTISGDTNLDIVGINENFLKVAYLRKPFTREIAKTGDATKGEVVAEATLEVRNGFAGFLSAGHL